MQNVLILGLVCGITATATAQIWDNGITEPTHNMYFSMLDDEYPFHCQVADDFRLNEVHSFINDVNITNITWVGGWVPWPPDEPSEFNFILYGDLGGYPKGMGSDDPTSIASAIRTIPLAELAIEDLGDEFYRFSADLSDDPITVDPTRTHWLAIQSVNTFDPKWGYSTTDAAIKGNHAVQGFPLVDVPYWTAIGEEMCFSLDGYEIMPLGDLTGDGLVDILDLLDLLSAWGPCPDPPADCPADLYEDGMVDVVDLLILLGNWS